jgi:hypothetical protein
MVTMHQPLSLRNQFAPLRLTWYRADMKSFCSLLIAFCLLLNSHLHAEAFVDCLSAYANASDACVQDCRCGFCYNTSSCLNGYKNGSFPKDNFTCDGDQWNYTDECVQLVEFQKQTNNIALIVLGVVLGTAVVAAVSVYFLFPRCYSIWRQREYTQISHARGDL